MIHGAGFVLRRVNARGANVYLVLKNRWSDGWSFPKGHKQRNESALVCALRECMEETGIDAAQIQLEKEPVIISYRLERSTRRVRDGVKRVCLFYGFLKNEPEIALSSEHVAFRWVSHASARALLRPEMSAVLL